MISQVVKKHIPIEHVMESPEMHASWIADRLERQAAYMLGRCLSSQLEMVTGGGINQYKMPKWARVRPLEKKEMRHRLPSGEWVVFDKESERFLFIQLPLQSLEFKYNMLNAMTDRSSINTALLHFLQYQDLLITSTYGPFHGIWNSVKNTMKVANKGRVWQCVTGFLTVINMNWYPFRTSQGFRDKQDGLKDYLDCHDHTDERFRRVMHKFAAANGLTCDDVAGVPTCFSLLGKMKSFNMKGPILKLMRWCSINTFWQWDQRRNVGAECDLRLDVGGENPLDRSKLPRKLRSERGC